MQFTTSDAMRAEIALRQQQLADDFRRANGRGTRRFRLLRQPRIDRAA